MPPQSYTVKSGDTLSQIASQFGVNIGDISGYRSGDPNKIYAGENLFIGGAKAPPAPALPSPNTINAPNLGASPYAVPPQAPLTGYAGLIESTNSIINSLNPIVEQGGKDIANIYSKLGQQSMNKANMYSSEGVYEKEKTYKDLVNTITAKDTAFRRRVEKIQEDNTTGQLASGQQIAINKEEREWARNKADLSIAAAFARDDYTTAKQIVDDKIEAETEGLKTQLDGLQFFYSQNFSRLSDAQKTLVQQKTAQLEQELSDKKSLLADIGKIQLEAAANGAPASTIVSIGKAADTTAAISAAGKYIGLYDRMKAQQDLSNGGAGSIKFTSTQLANGAANAGVPLATFQGFDKDTQNFFINGDISGAKSSINNAFKDEGASLEDVNAAIKDMRLPQQGEQMLLQYAQQTQRKNFPTLEQYAEDLKSEGYSRGEASDELYNYWSDDGKITLTKNEKKRIEDSLVTQYGRTFWQRVLPGGR